MNIFASDPSPILSAIALDDKRVCKMATETAQILSTAIQIHRPHLVPDGNGLYKPYNPGCGCCKWAAATRGNFDWLVWHGENLSLEYFYRFGKDHGASETLAKCADMAHVIPQGTLQPFHVETKHITGIGACEACRKYLNWKWATQDKRKPVWTRREPPKWFGEVWE